MYQNIKQVNKVKTRTVAYKRRVKRMVFTYIYQTDKIVKTIAMLTYECFPMKE